MLCHKNNINKKFIRDGDKNARKETLKTFLRYEYLWGVMA